MTLAPGTRLGPYEIAGTLGEGAMGVVYKARDTRLDRDVAVKVLPPAFSADADRLRRFQQEARAVGSLNHSNLVALYDVGEHDGSPYLVMELLDGETLRDKLSGRPLPSRRTIEIARGIAEGLSAAHDKGVVHRDLKPENIIVTRGGRVKILDFGLAKLRGGSATGEALADDVPTSLLRRTAVTTEAGTVLGSVGYMSPEQVRGQPLDARSDLFALGVILWEMLTGSRPFIGPSAVEAMHAIVHDEPPDLDPALRVPPVLERIVRTCLAKEPAGRFHSAHDLAFALETLSSGSHPSLAAASRPSRRSWKRPVLAAAGLVLVMAVAAGAAWRLRAPAPHVLPSFHKLTFGRGAIDGARFVPGSRDVAYSARWQGGPSTVYVQREGSVEPRALDAPGAMLLATSAQGGAAVMTGAVLNSSLFEGVVSTLPLAGGGTRETSRRAFSADFSTDGSELCLVTRIGPSWFQLEWPQGEVLVKGSSEILRSPRVRDGTVAFFQARPAIVADGDIRVAAKGKEPRSLAACKGFTSLAWGPDGREVWFSTFDGGESRIHAVTLQGQVRVLARFPGRLELADVDAAGRALAIVSSEMRQAFGRGPGMDRDVELTWLDAQAPYGLSVDGRRVLLARSTAWEMSQQVSLYLRPFDGGPATKLGMGSVAAALSFDGKWVATFAAGPNGQPGVRLIPTGEGASRWYPLTGPAADADGLWFHPSGGSLYLAEEIINSLARLDLATGAVTEHVVPGRLGYTMDLVPISPDGKRILLVDYSDPGMDDRPFPFHVFEGERAKAVPAKGNLRTEVPLGWADNGREMFLFDRNTIPAAVVRWDPLTGARRPFLQITPSDRSGVWGIASLIITPSGNAYAYSVLQKLSDLYLVEGLK